MRAHFALAAAGLLMAGCATTAPAPGPAPAPAPAQAARPAPVATPIPGLPAGAKVAVFPDSTLNDMAARLADHAEACWRGPGAPFAAVDIIPTGIVARDEGGAEAMRVTWAAIGSRYAGAAFTGAAFNEDIELEAADAVRGESRCGHAVAAPPPA